MHDDNPYSLDRLMELGFSMAVARQMIGTMNTAIGAMNTPGVNHRPAALSREDYFAVIDETSAGPFSEDELRTLVAQKKVTPQTYVWRAGMAQWERAERVPAVMRLLALAPPPIPGSAG